MVALATEGNATGKGDEMRDSREILDWLLPDYRRWIRLEEEADTTESHDLSYKIQLDKRCDKAYRRIKDKVETVAFVLEVDDEELWDSLGISIDTIST